MYKGACVRIAQAGYDVCHRRLKRILCFIRVTATRNSNTGAMRQGERTECGEGGGTQREGIAMGLMKHCQQDYNEYGLGKTVIIMSR